MFLKSGTCRTRENSSGLTALPLTMGQRELIGCCLSVSPPCWTSPGWLRPSGVKHLVPWFMCGTDALQKQSRMPLHINCGMGPSLMSPTFESGDVLHMFTYRRIRELVLVLTWRSASLLAILKATRDRSIRITLGDDSQCTLLLCI